VNLLAAFTDWVRRIVREEIAAEDERRSHGFAARTSALLDRWDRLTPGSSPSEGDA
jgi:hypothetical protein